MNIDDIYNIYFYKKEVGIQYRLKQQQELSRAKRVTVFRDPREDRGNNLSSLEKKRTFFAAFSRTFHSAKW